GQHLTAFHKKEKFEELEKALLQVRTAMSAICGQLSPWILPILPRRMDEACVSTERDAAERAHTRIAKLDYETWYLRLRAKSALALRERDGREKEDTPSNVPPN